jgi:hypothetical protein
MKWRAAAWLGVVGSAAVAQVPSYETRQQVQRSLVQVFAFDCEGGGSRKGSGFALDQPGQIVTAHHVVGGCRGFNVRYEGVPNTAARERSATLARVVAAGDLGLLRVEAPPQVPVLRLATAPPARDQSFAGFGYGLGAPTAGDKGVRFSSGATRLRDILPPSAAQELANGSRVALDAEVLRLDAPLEPGMSGGPIVNAAGEVVGVVAGGLKAGASTASWGWPGEGVRRLLVSNETLHQPLRNTSLFYSEQDFTQVSRALAQNRRLRCGELEFTDTGVRPLAELMRGADDWPRVQHIMNLSRESPQALASAQFQVWVHRPSGATALVPAGYTLSNEGDACVARSNRGPFQLLIWSARTPTAPDVQWRSSEFEQRIIGPRMPYNFGFQVDLQLTTWVPNPMTGMPMPAPQVRDNGLIFNRKGFTLAKRPMQFPGDVVPLAHGFHTLVARSGSFLGVATLNDEINPLIYRCSSNDPPSVGCIGASAHVAEWTRFVLATQLSTFPVY